MCIVVCEGKAGSCAFIFIIRLYGVLETSCLADDRYRSVAQSHQLAETARLKERRHEKGITGSIDLV